jgi:acyl dehydratase
MLVPVEHPLHATSSAQRPGCAVWGSLIDRLRLARPFRQGDVVTAQGQVVHVAAIKPGVHQVTRFSMHGADGDPIGELDYATITRGATLDGPPRSVAQVHGVPTASMPEKPLWTREVYISPDAAQAYTECADIYNPIHTERSVAKVAGLPDIILHGSATQRT